MIARSAIGWIYDAEVNKLRRAVRRDDNMARLQIAENKSVLVGKVDCLTDLLEELEPSRYWKPVPVAVFVDLLAIDPFNHEIRTAVRRCLHAQLIS